VPLLRRVAASPELIPGLLAVGVFIAWDAAEGGAPATSAYPGGLFLLGVLVATAIAFRGEAGRLPRLSRLALALLAAFTLWSFLSIAWAEEREIAWEGANKTLMYLTAFAVFSLPRWRATSAATVIGAYSLGVAAIGTAILIELATADDPTLLFSMSRLVEPTGYMNAVAALFAAAVWPAIFLASRRETPWLLRGLFLAAAVLMVQIALMPQSRGAFVVFPIALVIYLVVVPNRLRSVLVLLPVAAATALAAPTILDVFTVLEEGGDASAAIDAAVSAILTSAIVVAIVGALLGIADNRIAIPPHVSRLVGRGAATASAVAAAVAVVLVVGVIGNPVGWADERWQDFKGGYDPRGFGSSRLSGDLGSGRYDFWRVAIEDEFAESPLVGNGADNFAATYVRERDTDEEPLYPHSLPIRVLAGTGLVGALLLGSFLAVAIVAASRSLRRDRPELVRGVAAAGLVAFAYWLLHAGGDWLWTFPGLAAPALAWLALSARIEPVEQEGAGMQPAWSGGGWPAVLAGAGATVLVVVAAVSYMLPWAAARDVRAAETSWGSDAKGAYDRLDRARRLNFLSSEPDVVASAIASRLDQPQKMRAALERALEREPTNWYALLQLGTLDATAGDGEAARARLREAAELNPRDYVVREAVQRLRDGRPYTVAQVDREFERRVCAIVGRTEDTLFC